MYYITLILNRKVALFWRVCTLLFLVIANREITGDFKKEDLLKYRIFISKNIGPPRLLFKSIICLGLKNFYATRCKTAKHCTLSIVEQKSIRSLFVFNGFSSYVCLKDVDLNFIGTLQLKKFRKSGRFKVEEIFIVDSAHCLLTSYLFSVDEPKAKPSVSLHSEANLNTTITMAIRPSEWTRKKHVKQFTNLLFLLKRRPNP